jgi:hypothetical protein
MKPKPFRIFRAGTHTDGSGTTTTFTADDVKAMAQAYNEGKWRAPMVIGHPKGHAPAYGWVGKVRADDNGELWVDETEKLNPDFAELMKNGAYRNRSASLYAPDHPNNPTPGVWQLRHLGLLGAQPPAIKGLEDVEFADDSRTLTVDFADDADEAWGVAAMWRTLVGLVRSARESVIASAGIEAADKQIPAWQLDDAMSQLARAEERARQKAETTAVPAFSEGETGTQTPTEDTTMTPEQIAALQAEAAEAARLRAENTALQGQVQSFSESQATARRAAALVDATAALQPLVTAGKLLPNQLQPVADFMADLDDEKRSFDFGEQTGDNALTARGLIAALLAQAPTQVDYSEVTSDVQLPGTMKPTELAAKAREYQESMASRGVVITSTQAVDAVIAGKAS